MKPFLCRVFLPILIAVAPLVGEVYAKEPRAQPPVAAPGLLAEQLSPGENQTTRAGVGQQQPAAPQTSQPDGAPAGPTLDKLGTALKQIETSLESKNLTDQTLQDLRQQIDPVTRALAELIDRLTPRLGEIKDRLDQLGPKPSEDAPPESPAVTAERAQQQKFYNVTDEYLKRARLLSVEADQRAAKITAKRRALFTRSLFERAASIANPAIWVEVWQETPGNMAVIRAAFQEWLDGLSDRLDGKRLTFFWGAAAAFVLLYFALFRLAWRVFVRQPAIPDLSRFRKIVGAWWVTLGVAVPAAAMVLLAGFVLQYFELGIAQLQPLTQACGETLVRMAAAAGIARGLFAPTRPNWRLPKLSDAAAAGLVRLAITLAAVVSVNRLLEAINEIAGASLPVAVATHGLAASLGALAIGIELWRFGDMADAEDFLGPKISNGRDWFDIFRLVSWIFCFIVFVSVFTGYAAFASFLVAQFFWAGFVGCVLYMLAVLTEEAVSAGFTPNSRVGRRLITGIGVQRNSIELVGVLISGAIKLALIGLAVALVLAPCGLQSSDVTIDLGTAFFGFKVGDTTISPINIFIAAGVFALTLAALHAVLRWTDAKLLPRLNLDVGLKSSIRTSLAYVGFVIAASLALGYLGLNFEKLALVAGALSVGIGFGLQSIVNNFVSGLILLWERSVRVGDWIVVGSDQGFVRRINVRATEIETFDRSQVIIPNASLIAGVVTNLVRNDRTGRIVIPLTIVASADPEKVRETLLQVAKSHPLVLHMPSPQVLFTGMSASALNFDLRLFVADVETLFRVKSDLHFAIFKRFKEEGFFEAPQPGATKIEIAGFEDFGRILTPAGTVTGLDQAKRAASRG